MKIDHQDFKKLQGLLKKNGTLQAKIISDSMTPLIRVGDSISIEPVDLAQLKMFDIVVYWANQMLICHYVWKFNTVSFNSTTGGRIITKPLTQKYSDFPFPSEHILGRVTNFKISFWLKFKIFIQNWR